MKRRACSKTVNIEQLLSHYDGFELWVGCCTDRALASLGRLARPIGQSTIDRQAKQARLSSPSSKNAPPKAPQQEKAGLHFNFLKNRLCNRRAEGTDSNRTERFPQNEFLCVWPPNCYGTPKHHSKKQYFRFDSMTRYAGSAKNNLGGLLQFGKNPEATSFRRQLTILLSFITPRYKLCIRKSPRRLAMSRFLVS